MSFKVQRVVLAKENEEREGDLAAGSDQDIVDRVRAGQIRDFEFLVQRHQAQIYGLFLRQLADAGMSEDLTQEVFLRAFTKLSSFRGEASFSTWLMRIALNQSASYFVSRHYKQRRKQVLDDKLLSSIGELDKTEAREQERDLLLLQVFLGELKQRYRDPIVLCCIEQKSYQQAAEILDIPVGTVGSRINMGVKLLRDKFKRKVHHEC